jgi:signal transduction histidine kinase
VKNNFYPKNNPKRWAVKCLLWSVLVCAATAVQAQSSRQLLDSASFYKFKDYSKVISFSAIGYKKAIAEKNETLAGRFAYLLGFGNYLAANYEKSLEWYFESEKINIATDNAKNLSELYADMCVFYCKQKKYPEAENVVRKAIYFSTQAKDSLQLANAINNSGLLYLDENQLDKAIRAFETSNDIYRKKNDKLGMAYSLDYLSSAYAEKGAFDLALQYLEQSKVLRVGLGDKTGEAVAINNIGELHLKQKQPDKAVVAFLETISRAHDIGYTELEVYAYQMLAQSYEQQQNFAQALKAQTTYVALNKAYQDEKRVKAVEELQTKYETNKKDLRISLLHKTDSIKSLEIMNQNLKINAGNVQLAEQQLALSTAQLELSNQNEKLLQTQLDSTKNDAKIKSLQEKTLIQQLELQNQALASNRKNIFMVLFALVSALLFLLGYSAYRRFKIAQQIKINAAIFKQQELETQNILNKQEMRRQIAFDLHDEIGSSLSSIALLNERIKSVINTNTTEAQILLNKVSVNVRSSIENTQTIIWAIDARYDKIADLTDLMKEFAGAFGDIQRFEWTLHYDDQYAALELAPDLKKNLFLIFKESINNAIKYAQSEVIAIRIEAADHVYHLSIEDFGKGFERKTDSRSLGLRSIENRVQRMNGTASITSILGKGTKIALTVPTPITQA